MNLYNSIVSDYSARIEREAVAHPEKYCLAGESAAVYATRVAAKMIDNAKVNGGMSINLSDNLRRTLKAHGFRPTYAGLSDALVALCNLDANAPAFT